MPRGVFYDARSALATAAAQRLADTFDVRPWHPPAALPEERAVLLVEDGEEEEGAFSIFERLHRPFLLWFATPEQEFLDKLLREDLDRALAALPDHYRVVVVMADIEGLKYGEIAETLDVPIGTVRSRLARARSALQRMLWNVARDHGFQTAGARGT